MVKQHFTSFIIISPMQNDANGQEHIIDNLLKEAYELRGHHLSKSISLTERALQISNNLNLPFYTARALSRLALYHMIRGAHDSSIEMSNQAIEIFTELNDERGIAITKYSIASIFYKTDNHHLGMSYLLDCLISFRKFKDHHNESKTLKSLGTVYEYLGDSINAQISYKAAIASAKLAGDKNLESNVYNPKSGLSLKLGNTKNAMDLIKKSIKLKEETNDLRGMAFAIYGRGKVYQKMGEYEKALADFEKAIDIHRSFGEKLGEGMVNYKLAELRLSMGQPDVAKKLLTANIVFTKKYKSLMINLKCKRFLSQIYKEEQNAELSLLYLEDYTSTKEAHESSQTVKVIELYERAAILKSSEREASLELEKIELLAKKDLAVQAAQVRQEFLSVMSHEIRTPLNAVTSIISLLENRSDPQEQELLISLRFSSRNLLRIIDDILDFSKLDSNKMTLEKYPVNFKNFLRNIRLTYLNMAKEKGLNLKVSSDFEIVTNYLFDETKLFQILGNLLSNAIKYTNKGDVSLSVTLQKKTDLIHTYRFEIKDTGIGIAKEEINKLFDSFYIPASSTTRDLGGTGLGLAIVKKLINLHDSEIHIESKPNEGSTFCFDLDFEVSSQEQPSIKEMYASLENKKTILAEDNEVNALVLTRLLNRSGIEVIRAKDGEEVVEMSQNNEVDFILMDIHMPKSNGFEAVKNIRTSCTSNSRKPIFALTADITTNDRDEYREMFDGIIHKPIQIERLLAILSNTFTSKNKSCKRIE